MRDGTRLMNLAERELPRMLEDLRRLVELETPSGDKAALDVGLDEIERWLGERLGEPRTRVRHDGGEQGDVLDVTFPGSAAGTVLLLCHYDTVWPIGTLAEWPFTVEADKVTGPGCLDMKLGLVQAVYALRCSRELEAAHPSVRLLLNGDEEIGSHASREHIERACREAVATLVLEPSRDGMVKTRRKGLGLFDLRVRGIESHAGLDPEAGASAVHALAELIPALTRLADPERGTTINVGALEGGTGRNVVAGHARCQVDVRIQDPAEMSRIDAGVAALTPSDDRVRVEIDGEWNRPPMNPNPASQALFTQASAAAAVVGGTLEQTAVGGVSDANFVSALGAAVLDGLGAVGAGPHSRTEHVIAERSPKQVAMLSVLLSRLADPGLSSC